MKTAGKVALMALGIACGTAVYKSRAYLFTTDGYKTAEYAPAGVDKQKLAELGVPVEVIESLDPRDGGNITPEGDVLFLDESRLKLREKPDRPLRKNHDTGWGLKDKVVSKSTKKVHAGASGPKVFASIVEMMGAPLGTAKRAGISTFLGFEDSGYTHVQVMPLNVDVAEGHHNVVVPFDLIVQELKEADDIAILKRCICRTNFDCQHYPHDFGCIFLGPNAIHAIEDGLGERATTEEAIAHVKKAAEMGLMGAADFVEGEQFIWGVRNDEMNEYRMICLCCECCCLAMKCLKNSTKDISKRYAPVGWTATVNHEACIGCQACEPKCPQHCITYREDGTCVIDQDQCLGCGFCKLACEHDAIKIQQTMPMRESLNDYYLAEGRIDDGREHEAAIPTGLLNG